MTKPTGYEPLYTLKQFAPNVWVVDGGWIEFYKIPFPTRMTIVRLKDGGLWLHSPVANENFLSRQILDLGPVKYLIAPNWIHYAWLPQWQSLFPRAKSLLCPGVRRRAKSRGVSFKMDEVILDGGTFPWSSEIEFRLADSGYHKEVVFFHKESRTLILTDLIENFESQKMPWWTRPLLKLGGVCHPDGRMPRDMAFSFKMKRLEFKKFVEEIIRWNPERIILSHGRCYSENGVYELRRAFRDIL